MKRTFLVLLGVFCLVLTSFAQTKISGVVKDSRSGEILSGVAIAVQGAGTGTITSLDGTYSLNVDPQGALIVSYIGYETQSIPVKGRSVINIAMKEDMNLLDEVIVVGLWTYWWTIFSKSTTVISVHKVPRLKNCWIKYVAYTVKNIRHSTMCRLSFMIPSPTSMPISTKRNWYCFPTSMRW